MPTRRVNCLTGLRYKLYWERIHVAQMYITLNADKAATFNFRYNYNELFRASVYKRLRARLSSYIQRIMLPDAHISPVPIPLYYLKIIGPTGTPGSLDHVILLSFQRNLGRFYFRDRYKYLGRYDCWRGGGSPISSWKSLWKSSFYRDISCDQSTVYIQLE